MEAINARREAFYERRPGSNRLPKIRLTSCTRDGWGNLSGPAYKAAVVRQAAPFSRELVRHYCRTENTRDRMLRQVCTALDQLYDSTTRQGPVTHSGNCRDKFGQH